VELIATKGYKVGNIDATICAERPKLKAHIPLMQETMATVMGIDMDDISIKATTTCRIGEMIANITHIRRPQQSIANSMQ